MEINCTENMEMMFEKFEKFIKEKTVIGEPIQMGNITMIPALTVSFGMGNGGGNTNDKGNTGGTGIGGGIGARISPTAIIVVKGDDVQVLPISRGHAFEKLVEMVPDLVKKMDFSMCKEHKKSKEDNEDKDE